MLIYTCLAGNWGSALPATCHSLPVYLYLLSSAKTISRRTKYCCAGSNPDTDDLTVGNIRLIIKFLLVSQS